MSKIPAIDMVSASFDPRPLSFLISLPLFPPSPFRKLLTFSFSKDIRLMFPFFKRRQKPVTYRHTRRKMYNLFFGDKRSRLKKPSTGSLNTQKRKPHSTCTPCSPHRLLNLDCMSPIYDHQMKNLDQLASETTTTRKQFPA